MWIPHKVVDIFKANSMVHECVTYIRGCLGQLPDNRWVKMWTIFLPSHNTDLWLIIIKWKTCNHCNVLKRSFYRLQSFEMVEAVSGKQQMIYQLNKMSNTFIEIFIQRLVTHKTVTRIRIYLDDSYVAQRMRTTKEFAKKMSNVTTLT